MTGFTQRILKGFEDLSGFLSDVAGGQPWHYTRRATADGESTLFADDGSMVSVLEVRGSMEMIGADDFDQACRSLSQMLSARFASGGHVVQVVAKRDPADAQSSARASIDYMRRSAHNLGLDLDGVIADWAESVSAFAAGEHVWLVAWTRPAVMVPALRNAARKEMARRVRASNVPAGAQPIETRLMELYNDHLGFIEAIRTTMSMAGGSAQGGILVDVMDCKSALRMIRSEIDRDMTSEEWEPLIPGSAPPPPRTPPPADAPRRPGGKRPKRGPVSPPADWGAAISSGHPGTVADRRVVRRQDTHTHLDAHGATRAQIVSGALQRAGENRTAVAHFLPDRFSQSSRHRNAQHHGEPAAV